MTLIAREENLRRNREQIDELLFKNIFMSSAECSFYSIQNVFGRVAHDGAEEFWFWPTIKNIRGPLILNDQFPLYRLAGCIEWFPPFDGDGRKVSV